jgi:hypothetical protein
MTPGQLECKFVKFAFEVKFSFSCDIVGIVVAFFSKWQNMSTFVFREKNINDEQKYM